MLYGYADNKDDVLDVDKMFHDEVTLRKRARPQFEKLILQVRPGDTIQVMNLGQINWSIRSVILFLMKMLKFNINVISIKDNFSLNDPQTKNIITAIKDIDDYKIIKVKESSWHKDLIKPNYKEIDEDLWNTCYQAWKKKSISKLKWIEIMGIPYATFYRTFKRKYGNETNLEKQHGYKL